VRSIIGQMAGDALAPGERIVEPPPIPETSGWITGPPHFVGVGAQKSGTSWWFSLLMKHPRVFFPAHLEAFGRAKERNFFYRFGHDDFADRHVAEYHRWFPRPPDRLAGEWSPRYLLDHWTPPLLRRCAPEARLLVLLRDPVARFASGVDHSRRLRGASGPELAAHHFARGLYHQQLSSWCRHFPRQQLLVLQYELCARDPRAALRRTFEFLALEPFPASETELAERVNVSPPRAPLPPLLAAELAERYQQDMRDLARDFPEIDLALWPSARPR